MPTYTTDSIRNVALLGHNGGGKTTLAEQMLFVAGVTTRPGSVDEKTSLLDADDITRDYQHSLDTALAHLSFEGRYINLFDTPGYPDFVGPAIACLEAVETAIIVVNAHNGVETNTRRMFEQAKAQGLGIVFVINKIDTDYGHLETVLAQLQETFGAEVLPINLPANAGNRVIDCYGSERGETDVGDVHAAHVALLEAAIESDEGLLERYLAGGKVNPAELESAMDKAIVAEHVVPVLFTNARTGVGVRELLEVIAHFCPSPQQGKHRAVHYGNGPTARSAELDPATGAGHFMGQVVRVGNDPRSNIRYNVFRVFTGSLSADAQFFVNNENRPLKAAHLFKLQGAGHEAVDAAIAGDIVALPRLELRLGDVLHDRNEEVHIDLPKFPVPMFSQAITPKSRGDETKLAEALRQLSEKDPCLQVDRDGETHETLIRGLGDLHLRVTLERMKRAYKVEVETHPPRIPYRETITVPADGHHRHKKQTGGAGQFGEVFLKVEPMSQDDAEWPMGWKWAIFGGTISRSFEPAVRKGCEELMISGAIAGYPLQGVRIIVTDGKEHPVDSKEVAFRAAGKYALKEAIAAARPIILEPIVDLEVTVPLQHVGAITGDLASRRGRPVGQDNLPGGLAVIKATVPLSEMMDYAGSLSSMTGGQGSYMMQFASYEPAPPNITQALIKAHAGKAQAPKED